MAQRQTAVTYVRLTMICLRSLTLRNERFWDGDSLSELLHNASL